MDATTYDVVVIGAGPAGENAAAYAAQHGLTAAIVEARLVGGECSYWACMPSKALLRPTEVLAAARRLPAAAAAITGSVDVGAALAGRDEAVHGWDDAGQVEWLESAGIDLVRGHGRLAGPRQVEVTAADGSVSTLKASRGVVISTGTRATIPPIDGLDTVEAWDNHDVTEIERVPARLLVLGGGVVGVEMAQAIRRLGAEQITIVEASDRLVSTEEAFAADELRQALTTEGIEVRLGAPAVRASRSGDGPVTLSLEDGSEVVGDELLVAVGRRPLTDDLGLETIGVEPGRGGYLEVDERLRVGGHEWLYAVGDVNGRALLTHHGKYQARLVGDALAGVEVDPAWADDRAVVRVIFTDPQIAAVGRTEAQAREQGLQPETVRYDVGSTAGGSLNGRGASGTAQLVIDPERDVIVGATMVGPGVGEMIHAATIAVVGEVPLDRLWHAIPAFPTVSEVWLRLLEQVRTQRRPG